MQKYQHSSVWGGHDRQTDRQTDTDILVLAKSISVKRLEFLYHPICFLPSFPRCLTWPRLSDSSERKELRDLNETEKLGTVVPADKPHTRETEAGELQI